MNDEFRFKVLKFLFILHNAYYKSLTSTPFNQAEESILEVVEQYDFIIDEFEYYMEEVRKKEEVMMI